MKKLISAAVVAASLAAALPAAAQSWSPGARADRIEMRIDRGLRDGSLSWGEARRMRWQLNQVERLEDRYARNGLNGWEMRDLDRRYDQVAMQLRAERNDTQYRYGRSERRFDGY